MFMEVKLRIQTRSTSVTVVLKITVEMLLKKDTWLSAAASQLLGTWWFWFCWTGAST